MKVGDRIKIKALSNYRLTTPGSEGVVVSLGAGKETQNIMVKFDKILGPTWDVSKKVWEDKHPGEVHPMSYNIKLQDVEIIASSTTSETTNYRRIVL